MTRLNQHPALSRRQWVDRCTARMRLQVRVVAAVEVELELGQREDGVDEEEEESMGTERTARHA